MEPSKLTRIKLKNDGSPGHALPDAGHGGVKFVKPEVQRELDVLPTVVGGHSGIPEGHDDTCYKGVL